MVKEFNPDVPNISNAGLEDIINIRENLNSLRANENKGDGLFSTTAVAGQTISRLEDKENSDGVKLVYYMRNSANNDWLKIYDEEFGFDLKNNAEVGNGEGQIPISNNVVCDGLKANDTILYKGNDIDSNGDGIVDNAKHAEEADEAVNSNTLQGYTPGDFQTDLTSYKRIKTGSYEGTGSFQDIDVGFEPGYVKITASRGTSTNDSQNNMWEIIHAEERLNDSFVIRFDSTTFDTTQNNRMFLTDQGFRVDDDPDEANHTDTTYYYIAFEK